MFLPVLLFWRQCVCQARVKTINFGMFCPQLAVLPSYCDIAILQNYNTDHSTGCTSFSLELSIYLDKSLRMVTKGGVTGYYLNMNSLDLA